MLSLPGPTALLQSGTELAIQVAIVLLALVGFILAGSLFARLTSGEFTPSNLRERFRRGYRSAEDESDSSE